MESLQHAGPDAVHTLTVDRARAEALMLVLEAGFDTLIAQTAAESGSEAGADTRMSVLARLETAEAVLDELEEVFEAER